MLQVAGIHTFYGPVLGAVIVVSLDKLLGKYTLYWSSVTGVSSVPGRPSLGMPSAPTLEV